MDSRVPDNLVEVVPFHQDALPGCKLLGKSWQDGIATHFVFLPVEVHVVVDGHMLILELAGEETFFCLQEAGHHYEAVEIRRTPFQRRGGGKVWDPESIDASVVKSDKFVDCSMLYIDSLLKNNKLDRPSKKSQIYISICNDY